MRKDSASPPALAQHELVVAEQAVREAGALIRRFYEGKVQVSWKGVNDPVTAADRAANTHLVDRLCQAFPGDGILAEESADDLSRLNKERVWMVDPLDGTREFIDRINEFSVMVGLTIAGQPVLGVVYQPTSDVLYRAVPGQIAEVVTQGAVRPLAVSRTARFAAMRLVASRSHRSSLVDAACRRLGITRDRPSGSVGLKIGLLATGTCDLYLHPAPGLKEWDTCAPEAILLAAGGTVTDVWGRPLQYNKPNVRQRWGLIASNGLVHERIVAVTSVLAQEAGYTPERGFW